MRTGRIVDTRGAPRGEHAGIGNFTIGQRKRLPASGSGLLYVVALEPATNTVIVGSDDELYAANLEASEVNWIAIPGLDAEAGPLAVSARIRYNGAASPASISAGAEPGWVSCRFESPQRAVTPGQAVVFYSGDVVIGGGTIERAAK
jgi:tRNA-specific 2-thiouridylase